MLMARRSALRAEVAVICSVSRKWASMAQAVMALAATFFCVMASNWPLASSKGQPSSCSSLGDDTW